MARFFFHTADGIPFRDTEGTELTDVGAAQVQAIRLASALMQDAPEEVLRSGGYTVCVTDEAGLESFRLDIAATVGACAQN